MTMADTVAVMNQGRIEQMGSPVDLYESPNTAFVANFLGQSNLLTATIAAVEGDDIVLRDPDGTFRLPRRRVPEGVSTAVGSRVLVGIRPEKIHLEPLDEAGSTPSSGNYVDGVIDSASFTGVSTQYEVTTRSGDNVGVFVQNLRPGTVLAAGEKVRLTWAAEHAFMLSGDEDPAAGSSDAEEEGGEG